MRGIIYWHPWIYQRAMRVIYGQDFIRRYTAVASAIDARWQLLDLCCGDCYIRGFLDSSVSYEGRDYNDVFIRRAVKRGIKASTIDLKKNGLHDSNRYDCVIMMGSMHQFMPNEDAMIDSMKRAARKRVIVSEPVRNVVASHNPAVAAFARLISNPGDQNDGGQLRFSREQVEALYRRHGATKVIDAGKDLIGVFDIT